MVRCLGRQVNSLALDRTTQLQTKSEYKSESGVKLEIFRPMLDGVKVGQTVHESTNLCEESLYANCYTPSNFLPC